MAGTTLTRNMAENTTTFTLSLWVKQGSTGDLSYVYADGSGTGVAFNGDGTIKYQGGGGGSTTAAFKDTTAWYHLVSKVSSGTATLYLNGTQILTSTSQTMNTRIVIGGYDLTNSYDFRGGNFADIHFIDGTAYNATEFGETDSTTGIWKPKTAPSVTYGNDGFFLKFQNSGSMGTDSSGNGNTVTIAAAPTVSQSTNSPTNNFNQLNHWSLKNLSVKEGGDQINTSRTGNWDGGIGNMGVRSGKWYYEARCYAPDNSPRYFGGFQMQPWTLNALYNGKGQTGDPTSQWGDGGNIGVGFMSSTNSSGYIMANGSYGNTSATLAMSSGNWYIFQFALDLDNKKFWVGKDGTWVQASGATGGDPAGNNYPSFDLNISAYNDYSEFEMLPVMALRSDGSSGDEKCQMNFGEPCYTLSSAASDGNGFGQFEYAPPTGFYSLCTENIQAYGG